MDRWNDKVALVTGASTGIGRVIVEELVRKGMKVVALARRIDKIKVYADEIKNLTGKLYPLQCDLTKKDQVMQSMQWIEKNVGIIDVLINNAGIDCHMSFMESGIDDWQKTFDVNVLGLVAITKEFLMMKKKHGTMDFGYIFNINDFRCFSRYMGRDHKMSPAYMASKWALREITSILRVELCELQSKIKVVNIAPGLVRTEMTMRDMKGHIALEPRDIADSILTVMCGRDTVLIRDMTIVSPHELY
ncbi:farnesol dehydrogenase-like [Athalia rosae]|uniref:farnesol dehydrogenase-like n=1 Tax=Athalia rosae TaxID=37344 RepID=UPI0020335D0F|nr:farnesol dehydrogenase-like [Athalia rosae]